MRQPEQEFTSQEIPIRKASWMAQVLEQNPLIVRSGRGVSSLKVVTYPDRQDQEYITGELYVSGWSGTDEDRQKVPFFINYDWSKDEDLAFPDPRLTFCVLLPDTFQTPDMTSFGDNLYEGWSAWVADLIKQGHDVSPVVANDPGGVDEEGEYGPDEVSVQARHLTDPARFDFDHKIMLSYFYTGDYPKSRNDRQIFVNNFLAALNRTYKTAVDYAKFFQNQELPKLLQKRQETVNQKEPGWLLDEITRSKYKFKIIEHHWDNPFQGFEPYEFAIVAALNTPEGDSILSASCFEIPQTDMKFGHLELFGVFPARIQRIIRQDPDRFNNEFHTYLRNNKKIKLFDRIQPELPDGTNTPDLQLGYGEEVDERTGQKIIFFGIHSYVSDSFLNKNRRGPKNMPQAFHEFLNRYTAIITEMDHFAKTFKP